MLYYLPTTLLLVLGTLLPWRVSATVIGKSIWSLRKELVIYKMQQCWHTYNQDAYASDEYLPISHVGRNFSSNGSGPSIGYTVVDSLDTLYLAGLKEEYTQARDWVANRLHFDVDADVSVFETTIRVLGGLLGAFSLTDDAVYRDKARLLGDRLLAAFNTTTGLPYPRLNLLTGTGHYYYGPAGDTVGLAEVGSALLEFRALSHITGDGRYAAAVERVDQHLRARQNWQGLLPARFPVNDLTYMDGTYRMGAEADSYYEYLLKGWLQSGRTDSHLRTRYDAAMAGTRKLLVGESARDHLTFVGDRYHPDGQLEGKMEHLTCFASAMLTLGADTDPTTAAAVNSTTRADADRSLGLRILDTCVRMYTMTESQLSPESVQVRTRPQGWVAPSKQKSKPDLTIGYGQEYNLLRPETLESLLVAWRSTGNQRYREIGWEIFLAMQRHARTPDDTCFTSLNDVTRVPTAKKDLLESFVFAETFKYLLLLFEDDKTVLPLDKYVLNTEAHPLPIVAGGFKFNKTTAASTKR